MVVEAVKSSIEAAGAALENDKTLIIFTLLIYGVLALAMRVEGSIALIEKLSAALAGMAVGRSLK